MVTSVFICYRQELRLAAETLRAAFAQSHDFESWMDEELTGGVEWETTIYRNLLGSDVLLVTVGKGVSESEWVRREIALARAMGVSLVPVTWDLEEKELQHEMRELGISTFQWVRTPNLTPTKLPELVVDLRPHLEAARARTRESVQRTLEPLLRKQEPARRRAPNNQRAATFELAVQGTSVRLHVASGDIAEARNIDVLVSSENNWMQMARFFESRTVSSILRRLGARVHDGRHEDTIQHELDWQLRDRYRPVPAGEVVTTSAGAPGSALADVNKARYIMHAAAVEAVDSTASLVPFSDPIQIKGIVRSCLRSVRSINEVSGLISPPETGQREEQERRAAAGEVPIRSIAFPLFGSGHGGRDSATVVVPIIECIRETLSDPANADIAGWLEDIYISAFLEDDVRAVVGALEGLVG